MGRPAREWRSTHQALTHRLGASWLLREPLLHFLALGGLLFALHAILNTDESEQSAGPARVVRISVADAEWLKAMWMRQWRRPPTDEEFRGLLADHLREEVLAREARELQLDVGDTIVRRRLAQKMAFLLDDTIRSTEPPEAELRTLYETRPDLVRTPARVSFTQVYFNREQGQDRAAREAHTVLAALSDGSGESEGYGDRLLLGSDFVDQDEQSLSNLFGATFARAALSAEPGRWSGPVESGYGLHLVKVTGVQPSRTYDFAEVHDRLAQEWHRQRQEAAQAQHYADLMRKYQIVADPVVRALLGPVIHAEARP
jgi:hypothetical protein